MKFRFTRSMVFAVLLSVFPSNRLFAQTSVTIAGDLQSELGCGGDRDPSCGKTFLTYDANDDVWQSAFNLPTGYWNFKAALTSSCDVNYGLYGAPGDHKIPRN